MSIFCLVLISIVKESFLKNGTFNLFTKGIFVFVRANFDPSVLQTGSVKTRKRVVNVVNMYITSLLKK